MSGKLHRLIPTFRSDGTRIRSYSLQACLHLEGLSYVSVQRNARGEPRSMHFRDLDSGSPLRATAKQGQRYSYLERVGDDTRAWTHKRTDRVDPADFLAVVADLFDPSGGTHES